MVDGAAVPAGRAMRLTSLVAFFATLSIYSPNVMVVQAFDAAGLTGYFAEPSLVCAFAVALAVMLLRGGGRWCEGRAVGLACCALYVLGIAGYVAVVSFQPAFGAVLNMVFALCTGIGVIPVCVAWVCALRDLDLRGAVFAVACAGCISALCGLTLSHVPAAVALPCFLALLVVGVSWPFVGLLRGGATMSAPAGVEASSSDAARARNLAGVQPFLSVMGVPLLGMAIASFAMGVQPTFLFGDAVDAQRIGMVVGALALAPLARFKGDQPVYSFIYQVYLPASAVVVFVLCAFPDDSWMRDVALAVVYAFYSMVSGVAVASAVAIANAREFPCGFVVAALVGAFCGTGILGIFLGARIGSLIENNGAVLVVLTAAYGGGLLLSGCLKSWRLMVRPASGDPGTSMPPTGLSAETFEERIARIAVEHGLSPRETQIVQYVGRGHSSVYVAKTLLISESTVYSHVRNIYRKLGVSSREELIQLVNGPGDSSAE